MMLPTSHTCTMKQRSIPALIVLVAALSLLTLFVQSCMESTVFPEIAPRALEVNAEIVNTATGARTLLPGVTVRLFEDRGVDTADGRLVAEAVSDASGVARLTFDAPIVGQNFIVTG